MASNFFKVKNGLNVQPQASPTLDENGDIAYDSATHKVKARINGSTVDLATSSDVTGKASTALDNLASTAVNTDILPDGDNTRSLGSGTFNWSNIRGVFFGIPGTGTGRFGTPTATGSSNSGISTYRSGAVVDGTSGAANFGSGAASGTGSSGDVNVGAGTVVSGTRGVLNLLGRFFVWVTQSSDPSSPTAGGAYYNTTDTKPKFYNGSVWRFFHMVWSDLNGFTAETDVKTNDLLPLGDASASDIKKATVQSLYNAVEELTTETTVDQANDFFPMFDASGSATDKVSVNSMLGGVRPAFMATLSSNQSIGSSVALTKIQYNSEIEDTNGNYDNATNFRFTPTVPGYYLIGHYGRFNVNLVNTTVVAIAILFNGNQAAATYVHATASKPCGGFVMRLMYFNGSTDYVEAAAYQDSGFTSNWEASAALSGFFGIRVI
jgi:hypothetical protein